jgi:REP element-mobilizing transposase RayT
MNATFSQIYIHVVFTVRNRHSLILPSWEEQLYAYISGIIRNKGQRMLAINGMPDHVHLFFGMQPSCRISDLIREVKKSSVEFVSQQRFTPMKFSWQAGYGAFSYHRSFIDRVVKYILNQKEHHRRKSFKEEYIETLQKFGIDFREDQLFDWVDMDPR